VYSAKAEVHDPATGTNYNNVTIAGNQVQVLTNMTAKGAMLSLSMGMSGNYY
jgi:hypothetical protein